MTLLYVLLVYDFCVDRGKISKNGYSFLFPYIVVQIIISTLIVLHSEVKCSQSWFDMVLCADYLMFPIAAFAVAIFETVNYINKDVKQKNNESLKTI